MSREAKKPARPLADRPSVVSVVVPKHIWKDLRMLAACRDCSTSSIVRTLLINHLAESKDDLAACWRGLDGKRRRTSPPR